MIGVTSRRREAREDPSLQREDGIDTSFATVVAGLGRLTGPLLDALRREGIQPHLLDEATGGPMGLNPVKDLSTTTAIVGMAVAGRAPLQFLRVLREQAPSLRILFLPDRRDCSLALAALRQGADDILPPPHSVSAIAFRARVLHSRTLPDHGRGEQADIRGPGLQLDRALRTASLRGQSITLTGREFELLERLLEAGGSVVSRDELLLDIWGAEQESAAVLDATVHRLRRKLEPDPAAPDVVATVRGVGYRVQPALVPGVERVEEP